MKIRVAVIYALPERQEIREVELEAPATVGQAVAASELREAFPGLDPGGANPVGVFGKRVSCDAALRDGDQVEIYRGLAADPKDARRQRAARGRGR
jgi:putative ubiquitin-RnfH superfamily antitoxin RatB of RatAB toxin-antitoxin module